MPAIFLPFFSFLLFLHLSSKKRSEATAEQKWWNNNGSNNHVRSCGKGGGNNRNNNNNSGNNNGRNNNGGNNVFAGDYLSRRRDELRRREAHLVRELEVVRRLLREHFAMIASASMEPEFTAYGSGVVARPPGHLNNNDDNNNDGDNNEGKNNDGNNKAEWRKQQGQMTVTTRPNGGNDKAKC